VRGRPYDLHIRAAAGLGALVETQAQISLIAGLEIEIIETRKPDKHAPETEARPPRYVSWAIGLIWSLTAVRSPKPFLTLAPASLE
jgi:hypothetical protein